jgi:hypothetical protein
VFWVREAVVPAAAEVPLVGMAGSFGRTSLLMLIDGVTGVVPLPSWPVCEDRVEEL